MPATSIAPTSYLNGYTSPVTNYVQLGTQDQSSALRHLPALTTAEANQSTGDIRRLYWALCQMMWQSSNFVPNTSNPVGNTATARAAADSTNASTDTTRKTNKMTASQFASTDTSGGSTVITQTFTFVFTLGASSVEVADE